MLHTHRSYTLKGPHTDDTRIFISLLCIESKLIIISFFFYVNFMIETFRFLWNMVHERKSTHYTCTYLLLLCFKLKIELNWIADRFAE